jgi:molecular chaperone DnaJ
MATSNNDFYDILGVKKDASAGDIKKAFRRLARKYHPDVNPGDKKAEQKFKEINEAYEILGDPKKREQYDQYGATGFEGIHGFEGFGTGGGGFTEAFSGFGSAEDIFSGIFGGFQQRERPLTGQDLLTTLDISLEEAYRGATRTISLSREVACKVCAGSGAEASKVCSDCNGAGAIKQGRGFFNISQPCPSCRGKGRIVTKACVSCGGSGRRLTDESLNVKIPPGADTGSKLKLKGKGGAGYHGGPAGDLYIEVTVRRHPQFQREKNNIYVDVPVTIIQATLGGKVQVPTLDGTVTMTLPPGTDSGKKFKLRGKGIPERKTGVRGDQYAVIKIIVPKKMSDATKEALQEVEAAYKQ